jgi:hypothetical protein
MDRQFQDEIAKTRAGLTPGRPEDNDLNFLLMELAMMDEFDPSSPSSQKEEDPKS